MANKKRTQNKRIKRAGKKQRRRTAAKQRGGGILIKRLSHTIIFLLKPLYTKLKKILIKLVNITKKRYGKHHLEPNLTTSKFAILKNHEVECNPKF